MFVQTSQASKSILSRRAVALLSVIFAAAFVAGCSDAPPTGIDAAGLSDSSPLGSLGYEWAVLAQVPVSPTGGPAKVEGGRYILSLPAGAVSQPVTISISEAVADPFLFEIGPVGFELERPAVLQVDYAGTVLDPSHPEYNGGVPQLWTADAEGLAVERINGSNEVAQRRFVAPIADLSRFRLVSAHGGTYGWD